MTEDERTDEESASAADGDDVEAHGAKKIVGTGLAAAALLGAGAAGVVKLTDDDKRIAGALTTREDAASSLARADRDGDGYLSYRELSEVGVKWNLDKLNAEGSDVTAEGLSAAGFKQRLDLIGDDGFLFERNLIFLKYKVDEDLDALVEGRALEWSSKLKEVDRDGDGYASLEELSVVGMKLDLSAVKEAGYDVTAEELEKAGMKMRLDTLGEGGYVTKADIVMFAFGVDSKVDAFIKGESENTVGDDAQ